MQPTSGVNHNIFYQNSNLYPTMGMPHGALAANNKAEIGVQQNEKKFTAMQSPYPRPSYNEQQRFH